MKLYLPENNDGDDVDSAAEQVLGTHGMRTRHKDGLLHLQIFGTQRKKSSMCLFLHSENLL